MLIRRPPDLPAREITEERLFWNRRRFVGAVGQGIGALAFAAVTPGIAACTTGETLAQGDDKLTPYEDVTGYNNFYEFGTGKGDPKENAGRLRTRPWTVAVEGEIARPATYALDDLLRPFPAVERIYRHRCVEGWSMVVPWMGFPLRDLVRRLEPTSKARFVEFTTLHDPAQMPG